MRKTAVILAAAALLLSGCAAKKVNKDEERAQKYASFITAIEGNTEFKSASSYYTITTSMNKLEDGTYRYDIIVDEPLIAMYGIEMLAIPKDVAGTLQADGMCPSLGILEGRTYNLVPNQVAVDKGYPEGVIISGTTDLESVSLDVLVVWTGYAKLAENREYFSLTAAYQAPAAQ